MKARASDQKCHLKAEGVYVLLKIRVIKVFFFLLDFLQAQKILTLIESSFERCWLSNSKLELLKGEGGYLANFIMKQGIKAVTYSNADKIKSSLLGKLMRLRSHTICFIRCDLICH